MYSQFASARTRLWPLSSTEVVGHCSFEKQVELPKAEMLELTPKLRRSVRSGFGCCPSVGKYRVQLLGFAASFLQAECQKKLPSIDVKDIGIPSRDSVDHTMAIWLTGRSHNEGNFQEAAMCS